MRLDKWALQRLEDYLTPFNELFWDRRHIAVFQRAIRGVIAAEAPLISKIGGAVPHQCKNNFHAAKPFYRLLDKTPQGVEKFSAADILDTLYRKTYDTFKDCEEPILVAMDLTSLEKPYTEKSEGICLVEKNDKSGQVNGYMLITGLALGGVGMTSNNGKKGLAYFKVFSHQLELMSQNAERRLCITQIKASFKGKRLRFVSDRGFDDKKAFREFIGEERDEFIVRAYQNRLIKVNGEERKLLEYVRGLEYCLSFDTELKIKRRRRKVKIDLSIGSFECEGMKLWVVRTVVRGFKEEWILITNVPVTDLDTALEIWRNYARRWGIEDFYKFAKNNLNLEAFQVEELEKIRKVLSWVAVAGAFLYDLGVDINDPHVKLLLRLGGFAGRKRDKPGKGAIERGLSRLFIAMMVNKNLKNNSS
ncbi:MAG: hypothetical protein E3I13_02370 [Gammaproteobacteria bacterium]|nr:MAG: hypothetical protein E3I13_02370 [Gammaproteobacteria bacterium]